MISIFGWTVVHIRELAAKEETIDHYVNKFDHYYILASERLGELNKQTIKIADLEELDTANEAIIAGMRNMNNELQERIRVLEEDEVEYGKYAYALEKKIKKLETKIIKLKEQQ